ncbi:MAG: ABC transporter transmembrane domain-containing protein, partial [Candidatus Zixiibacteriota bacterium]
MLSKIKWFWRFYRKYSYLLLVLLILTPAQAVFQVSIPRMIDFTVDYLDTDKVPSDSMAIWINGLGESFNLSPAVTFGLCFIRLGLIASILYFIVQSHRAWMNIKLEWLFRQDAFDKMTYKGPDFFNRFRTGDLVTRMTDDVAEKLSWFACSGIFRLYEALLMVGFTVAMMIMIDPILTIWAVGPLPILIVIFFISSTVLDKRYDYLQTRISKFNDILEACFSGIRVVKAYVKENAQKSRFEDAAVDRRKAEISSIKTSTIIDSLYMYIWQFSILVILIVGGYMVMNGELSR